MCVWVFFLIEYLVSSKGLSFTKQKLFLQEIFYYKNSGFNAISRSISMFTLLDIIYIVPLFCVILISLIFNIWTLQTHPARLLGEQWGVFQMLICSWWYYSCVALYCGNSRRCWGLEPGSSAVESHNLGCNAHRNHRPPEGWQQSAVAGCLPVKIGWTKLNVTASILHTSWLLFGQNENKI